MCFSWKKCWVSCIYLRYIPYEFLEENPVSEILIELGMLFSSYNEILSMFSVFLGRKAVK